MTTVHWLGAGLSSAPGIRRLARGELSLVLWNRTRSRAEAVVQDLEQPPPIRELDFDALGEAVTAGDILVSMLPGTLHYQVARLALDRGANFVSSSYIAEDMRGLQGEARSAGLCLVNEVGLDPGLDHLMAHLLVDEYRRSDAFDDGNTLAFRSYCGGFPSIPNDFRYKFSWSPLGVLRALKSPARSISEGAERTVHRPWLAITDYRAQLPEGLENFEAYPNRDSLPFLADYGFDPEWPVREFVRGTLRLPGWSTAWEHLFAEIDTLEGDSGEARLQAMSEELWRNYRYQEDEPDRVVLCVELEASDQRGPLWHRGYAIDARGGDQGSAMARLVSLTVALAVESVAAGKIAPGVSAAPSQPELIRDWFGQLQALGEQISYHDYLEKLT